MSIDSPSEFAAKMRESARIAEPNTELAHIEADGLMCELLRSLGYGDGIDVFDEMKKWYT